jgi:hypothetical protein
MAVGTGARHVFALTSFNPLRFQETGKKTL